MYVFGKLYQHRNVTAEVESTTNCHNVIETLYVFNQESIISGYQIIFALVV